MIEAHQGIEPLCSATSEECRIDSIGQSWSVLSRAGDPARSAEALDAAMRELVDPETDLVRPTLPGEWNGWKARLRIEGRVYRIETRRDEHGECTVEVDGHRIETAEEGVPLVPADPARRAS